MLLWLFILVICLIWIILYIEYKEEKEYIKHELEKAKELEYFSYNPFLEDKPVALNWKEIIKCFKKLKKKAKELNY
jgi:hypothetical protein